MLLAAHQPNYLPNLGFFHKMALADHFIIITNVQFSKGDGWVRRHKIPGRDADQWLTVPVLGSRCDQSIRDVSINQKAHWRRKHKRTLEGTYRNTKEREVLDRILALYETPWERLVDFNVAVIHCLRDLLGIETPLTLDEETGGQKQELLLNLCRKYDADAYLSGKGGKLYMTQEYYDSIDANGVSLQFVEENLTEQYPYTILHYLLTQGLSQVQEQLALPITSPVPA
jgi:hypothetical protein